MPVTPHKNRKCNDADIIRMNSVGLSLSTISEALGVHPSTITHRLKALNVAPSDTRRSFMEDIFIQLSTEQQEFLADRLGGGITIKDYIRGLLIKAYVENKG